MWWKVGLASFVLSLVGGAMEGGIFGPAVAAVVNPWWVLLFVYLTIASLAIMIVTAGPKILPRISVVTLIPGLALLIIGIVCLVVTGTTDMILLGLSVHQMGGVCLGIACFLCVMGTGSLLAWMTGTDSYAGWPSDLWKN